MRRRVMKIFVGELPKKFTEEDLKKEFEKYGHVTSVYILRENVNGDDFNYGLVEMPVTKQAVEAIARLDGKKIQDVVVNVHQARTGTKNRRKSGRGGGRRRDDPSDEE
jgi:RNA recognition motif-containing protein